MIWPYLTWFINGLIGLAFVLLGYYTFGNALLFDRLFLLCLIFAGVFCRKDVNILSVVIIIFAGRMLDEAAYQLLENPDLLLKIMIYPLLAYAIYRFKDDELFNLAIVALAMCLSAETYWLAIGYQPPDIMWSMFGITLNMTVRHALIFRLFVIEKFFPDKAEDIMIDFIIRLVAGIHVIVGALMIVEYLVRHLGIANPLYIYSSYGYISQAIAVVTMWALFHQTYQLRIQAILKA